MDATYINARFLTQRTTGVQRFATEISRELKKLHSNIKFLSPFNVINKDLENELDVIKIGKQKGHLWEQVELPMWLNRRKNPLLVNLANTGPLFYNNQIITIHDLAFHHHPEWFSKKFSYYYKLIIPLLARKAKKILTVSYFVKNDIIDTYNIKANYIHVIYNAPSKVFTPLNLKRNIILSVSSLEPRKNLGNLIKSFELLNSQKYELVLVGEKNKVFNSMPFDFDPHATKIKFTGYISDQELNYYYNKAILFIYPSLYEGFGLPPIEAQACKTPVLVSKIPALIEVCGKSAQYFNPLDPIDIANKINMLVNDKEFRDRNKKEGWDNINRFHWQRSAEQVMTVINSCNFN